MADMVGRDPNGNSVPLACDAAGRLLISSESISFMLQDPMTPSFEFPIQFTNGQFLWMDNSGNTRVNDTAPTAHDDGTIVTP